MMRPRTDKFSRTLDYATGPVGVVVATSSSPASPGTAEARPVGAGSTWAEEHPGEFARGQVALLGLIHDLGVEAWSRDQAQTCRAIGSLLPLVDDVEHLAGEGLRLAGMVLASPEPDRGLADDLLSTADGLSREFHSLVAAQKSHPISSPSPAPSPGIWTRRA